MTRSRGIVVLRVMTSRAAAAAEALPSGLLLSTLCSPEACVEYALEDLAHTG